MIDWTDLNVSIGDFGAFDYVGIYHYGMSPYESYVDDHLNSARMADDLTHTAYIESEEWSGSIPLPTTAEEAFADLILNVFETLIDNAYFLNDASVPTDLNDLLTGFAVINPKGWSHPVGPLSEGTPGNFEYGVDPDQNGYYFKFTTSEYDEVVRCYRFVRIEVNGQEIYDFSTSMNHVERVMDTDSFQNRIPILTDEMFASPAPVV